MDTSDTLGCMKKIALAGALIAVGLVAAVACGGGDSDSSSSDGSAGSTGSGGSGGSGTGGTGGSGTGGSAGGGTGGSAGTGGGTGGGAGAGSGGGAGGGTGGGAGAGTGGAAGSGSGGAPMGGTCTETCSADGDCDDGYTCAGTSCECVDDLFCNSGVNDQIDLSRTCTGHGDCTGSNEFCVKAGNGVQACGRDESGVICSNARISFDHFDDGGTIQICGFERICDQTTKECRRFCDSDGDCTPTFPAFTPICDTVARKCMCQKTPMDSCNRGPMPDTFCADNGECGCGSNNLLCMFQPGDTCNTATGRCTCTDNAQCAMSRDGTICKADGNCGCANASECTGNKVHSGTTYECL